MDELRYDIGNLDEYGIKPSDIEGKQFDCYTPDTSNVRNMWSTIRDKTAYGQTKNFVLNLDDLVKQFYDWNQGVPDLDEVLIII